MRISDWSSDVCSSDLYHAAGVIGPALALKRPIFLGLPIAVVPILPNLTEVGGGRGVAAAATGGFHARTRGAAQITKAAKNLDVTGALAESTAGLVEPAAAKQIGRAHV